MAEMSKRDRGQGQAKAKPAQSTKATKGIKGATIKTGASKSAAKSTAPKSSSLQKIKVSPPKTKGKR